MHAHEIVLICGILAAGFVCQWVAWRAKTPAILFLLLLGITAGPVLGWLEPVTLFGDLMVPLVSIGVAIILFEGSLTLKFSEIRAHSNVVRNLVSVGVAVTWIGSALAAHLVLDWDPYLAALFGAIVTVSGPTVVMPLLRTVRPSSSISRVLRWEAILIDPLGAILGLLVFDIIVATQISDGIWQVTQTFVTIVGAGTLFGALGGYLFGLAIRARVIPDFLRDYAALASVLAIFAAAEAIHGETGLLAVTVMGIWLANMHHVELDDIYDFKESLTLLLVAGLFIVLAARVDLNALWSIGYGAIGIIFFMQFILGPLRAFLSSIGSSLSWKERLYVGWVFPRGIVAAAISALFALRLEDSGYPQAEILVPLVFSVILGTVIIQSLSARLVARYLDVAEPDPNGVLLVGSNPLALAVATSLQNNGQTVLIADTHWPSIQRARMSGLPTFYGSAVSSYADRNMELTGFGSLFAVSRNPGLNELACLRFSDEFGRDNVFTVSNQVGDEHEKHKVSGDSRGRVLFGGDYSLQDLIDRLSAGGELKTTELTDEFDLDRYKERHPENLPIYAIDEKGRTHFMVADGNLSPAAGWSIAAMVQP